MSDTDGIEYESMFRGLANNDISIIESLLTMQVQNIEASGLDVRSHALVRLAALISVGAPPASYEWQVGVALESGVTPREILGLLIALAPTVGMPRVVAAAPELAYALEIDIDDDYGYDDDDDVDDDDDDDD
jgi:alkylhydroperoxidase/carboxymuconolactone decarboxylase family protein YurZ